VKSLGDPEGVPGGAALDGTAARRRDRRSTVFLVIAGTLAVLFFVLFVALGTWQVKRRVWKLDLIARVEQRVHAPPAAAPAPAEWPNVTAAADEYRHVVATGTFLDDSQTLVQAVTDLGAGYWVLTPLRLADGSIVLVNRGFVAADDRDRVRPGTTAQPTSPMIPPGATAQPTSATIPPGMTAGPNAIASQPATTGEPTGAPPAATARVIGLLRMTEPRGGFLRHNDAAANRWYSRDVQAITAARGLTRVAPYFIDAEAAADQPAASASPAVNQAPPSASSAAAAEPGDSAARAANGRGAAPVAGLTVITFHNSHLVYAITWYTLALMVAGAIWLGIRSETRT
jgi:surfeit locus 1 family protein